MLEQNDINIWNGGAISSFCLLFLASHLPFVWSISGHVFLNISITNCNTVTYWVTILSVPPLQCLFWLLTNEISVSLLVLLASNWSIVKINSNHKIVTLYVITSIFLCLHILIPSLFPGLNFVVIVVYTEGRGEQETSETIQNKQKL